MNLKKTMWIKFLSAVLSIFVYAGIVLSPVSAYAITVDMRDMGFSGAGFGKPDHVPPVNPPIDTPAFDNGLVNTPDMMPPSVPSQVGFGKPDHVPPVNPPIDTPAFDKGLMNTPDLMPPSVPSDTLPGSNFGQAVVPVPAAVWLFSSGLLGLVAMSRRKKSA